MHQQKHQTANLWLRFLTELFAAHLHANCYTSAQMCSPFTNFLTLIFIVHHGSSVLYLRYFPTRTAVLVVGCIFTEVICILHFLLLAQILAGQLLYSGRSFHRSSRIQLAGVMN